MGEVAGYVQSQFSEWALTSKPQELGLTEPPHFTTDSDLNKWKRDGSNGMIPKLEKDEEGWAILPSMGNHSLEDCNAS